MTIRMMMMTTLQWSLPSFFLLPIPLEKIKETWSPRPNKKRTDHRDEEKSGGELLCVCSKNAWSAQLSSWNEDDNALSGSFLPYFTFHNSLYYFFLYIFRRTKYIPNRAPETKENVFRVFCAIREILCWNDNWHFLQTEKVYICRAGVAGVMCGHQAELWAQFFEKRKIFCSA